MTYKTTDMITVAHRIQLMPNNKQKTCFRKAIGCARFAYNWGLAEWKRRYKEGERGLSGRKLQAVFNTIKREQFPWACDVTSYATCQAFEDLQTAFNNFFEHRAAYPTKHRKKDGMGKFYFAFDRRRPFLVDTKPRTKHLKDVAYNTEGKHQYINIYHVGFVKMSQRLRFNGKPMSVRISQEGDKFFASILVQITEEEYRRTHRKAECKGSVGIDLGVEEAMTLSDGIAIHNPRTLSKHQRKITRLNRQLRKRQHAKTKQERLQGVKRSNNYRKLSRRLSKEHQHVANIRRDFTQKLTTILTTQYKAICIEDLNVSGMVKNHKLAKSVSDMAFGELRRQIEYKAALNGVSLTVADRFYPSSKTCSHCGAKKDDLTLKERTFVCPECGHTINRDLNAALNLLSLIQNVGADYPELTPADLTALQSRFALNRIATSKVETGRQHQSQDCVSLSDRQKQAQKVRVTSTANVVDADEEPAAEPGNGGNGGSNPPSGGGENEE